MSGPPYTVYVVVDPNFGERLASLPIGVPVWIVDTPANKPVAKRLWVKRVGVTHLNGITTYSIREGALPEENLLQELYGIDLHHGCYSHTPPYTKIEVLGTVLSENIRIALAAYGFNHFSPTPEGFTASRPVPTEST